MKLFSFQCTSKNDRGQWNKKIICSDYETFLYKLKSFSLTIHWDYWETEEQKEANQNPPEVNYREAEDREILDTKCAFFNSNHFFIVEK